MEESGSLLFSLYSDCFVGESVRRIVKTMSFQILHNSENSENRSMISITIFDIAPTC